MFLTRIGENSNCNNGDPSQIDLPNRNNSGLKKFKKSFNTLKKFLVNDHSDVVRHPLVSKIVKVYLKKKMIKANVVLTIQPGEKN